MADDTPDSTSDSKTTAKATSLSDAGGYYLCGHIEGSSCKPAIEWILSENLKGKQERLTLIVSSYGGEVYPAFALIDAMIGSAIPVDTLGLGYIASAGLTIFIHGAVRRVTPNTFILAHQYAGWSIGKHHELLAGRKEQDWLMERFIDMHVRQSRGKLTRDDVKAKLMGPSDTFITAEEALSYGLVDEIRLSSVAAPIASTTPTL